MPWRIGSFLLFELLGAAAGWWLYADRGAMAGIAAGGLAWLALDLAPSRRVLRWLREGAPPDRPALRGVWGEAVERMGRALRSREQQAVDAQRRLQEFLAAIQASPNGVILLDARGSIEWCNQTAAEHFGIDPQRDMLQLIGNLLRDPRFAAYYAAKDYGQEVVMQAGGTPSRPLKLSVHLHPYGEGRKLLLSRDITALEKAETMRRDFVANVSHEMRTPLTVLAGFVETLQNLPLSEDERARYLAMMAQQAQRMQALIDDLLTLSRLEGSPLPSANEWTPVAALMRQCEQDARALGQVMGKTQDIAFHEAPPLALAGSPTELLSALSNLVNNAIRYTPANGSVDVRWTALPQGRAGFSVRDSGPGIPAEHLSRLTERFYRVDRSRSRETGGTGLGLAIVKHVVQRHGAELKIDSTPGMGSTFSIQFPASRLRAAAPADAAGPIS